MSDALTSHDIEKSLAKLRSVLDAGHINTLRALVALGLKIMGQSRQNCPVQYGNLRASHYVLWRGKGAANQVQGQETQPVFQEGEGVDVARLTSDHAAVMANSAGELGAVPGSVVEVGATAYYAMYVHENMEAHHPVGHAKFMSTAVDQVTSEAAQLIQERLAKGDKA